MNGLSLTLSRDSEAEIGIEVEKGRGRRGRTVGRILRPPTERKREVRCFMVHGGRMPAAASGARRR
jgi:hypothetical protein